MLRLTLFTLATIASAAVGVQRPPYSLADAQSPLAMMPNYPQNDSLKQANNLQRNTQKRPAYIYVDHWESTLEHADLITYIKDLVDAGASDVLLAFVVPGAGDALDTTGQYERLTAAERTDLKSYMASKGARLRMSIGGGNYGNRFMQFDPFEFANTWCAYAKDKLYDGVDFDLEGFSAQSKEHPEMAWISKAVDACHDHVQLVSHAPQAPNIGTFSNFAFEGVIEDSINDSDRFLIQYYNQPPAPYTDYGSVFVKDNVFHAAIRDIEERIPSSKGKLVFGKFLYGFGGAGALPVDQMVSLLEQAESEGYTGGVMIWKSPARGTSSLNQFLASDLPRLAGLGSSPTATTTTTSKPAERPTTTLVSPPIPRPTSTPNHPGLPNPTTTTIPRRTTTMSRRTTTTRVASSTTRQAPSTGGSPVEQCQASIGHESIPTWDEDCKSKCEFYFTSGKAWCPAANDGVSLIDCVLRMTPGQCSVL